MLKGIRHGEKEDLHLWPPFVANLVQFVLNITSKRYKTVLRVVVVLPEASSSISVFGRASPGDSAPNPISRVRDSAAVALVRDRIVSFVDHDSQKMNRDVPGRSRRTLGASFAWLQSGRKEEDRERRLMRPKGPSWGDDGSSRRWQQDAGWNKSGGS